MEIQPAALISKRMLEEINSYAFRQGGNDTIYVTSPFMFLFKAREKKLDPSESSKQYSIYAEKLKLFLLHTWTFENGRSNLQRTSNLAAGTNLRLRPYNSDQAISIRAFCKHAYMLLSKQTLLFSTTRDKLQ